MQLRGKHPTIYLILQNDDNMKEYTFSYRFDNKTWTISIYANSEEEAKRKFWALKENGQY